MFKKFSLIDQCLIQINHGLNTLCVKPASERQNPASQIPNPELSLQEQKHCAGLMRVNHTGEVCAQALYYGQMLVARNDNTYFMLQKAAIEETDHLAWTQERIAELQSHTSYLNLFWYWHSFGIGMVAGLMGDHWSLGFVEETERQVGVHLDHHLNQLSLKDTKSRIIIEKMREDEEQHRCSAQDAGAQELPWVIKKLMTLQSKIMTSVTYWI